MATFPACTTNAVFSGSAILQNFESFTGTFDSFTSPQGFTGQFIPDGTSSLVAGANSSLVALQSVAITTGANPAPAAIYLTLTAGCLNLTGSSGITFAAKGVGNLVLNFSDGVGNSSATIPLTTAFATKTVTWASMGVAPPHLFPTSNAMNANQLNFVVSGGIGSLAIDDVAFIVP